MAFGFTPKFEESLDLNGLHPEGYLVVSIETAKRLEWKVDYTSKSGLVAIIGGGAFSSMEQFTLIIQGTNVSLKSENVSSGMYDWGRNKKHVEDFIETFDAIFSSMSEAEIREKVDDVFRRKPISTSPRLTLVINK